MQCPKCNFSILNENINIQANIAKCNGCDHVFKASEAVDVSNQKFNIAQPPNGAWYKQEIDKIIIGASTRSAIALYLIPFTCVWSGFSLGSLYGGQIASQEFDLFLSLFGLPFFIVTLYMLKNIMMSIFGKVEIQTDRNGGTIFTGVGFIGKKQSFHWRDIATINNGIHRPLFQRNDQEAIVMEGTSSIVFGADLNEERIYYVLNALKKLKNQQHR